MLGDKPEHPNHEGDRGCDARADGKSRPAGTDRTIRILEQRIADDGERQSGMPEPIEPDGGLQTRAKQTAARECPREGQCMRNDD